MKNKIILSGFVLTAIIGLSSCTSLSYTPKVSLDISTKTIQKNLQVEKFKNLTKPEDSKAPFMGVSTTDKDAMPAELDLGVTNAIVEDFSNNSVFKQVSRRIENPDYILKGEIKRFSGIYKANNYAKWSLGISYTGLIVGLSINNPIVIIGASLPVLSFYFGIPIDKETNEVEIIVYLYNNKNELVGTYSGKASAQEQFSMYSKNKVLALPTELNRTFSKAVQEIREKILVDIAKIEAQ